MRLYYWKLLVFSCVFFTLLSFSISAVFSQPNYFLQDLTYQVHWVGNSFAGTKIIGKNKRQHVQQSVADLFVMPDGTCYTNALWDERFAQASVYRDGQQIAIMDEMMGWGKKGGYGVTGDNRYIYVSVEVNHHKGSRVNKYGNPITPQPGKTWYGVRRYHQKTGEIADFSEGYGIDGGTIVVNTNDGHVQGLALDKKLLYVSDTANNSIKVYELRNLSQQPIFTWSVRKPGKLAFDREGYLWVVEYGTNKIHRLQPNGEPAPQTIILPDGAIASDLAIDRHNRLLVTDIGIDHNVKIYSNIDTNPTYQESFGEKGGIFAGESGKFADLKFYKPKGIGSDRAGNIYIAEGASSAIAGGGTILSSYQPNGQLRWRIHSLEFMSGLDFDPADEQSLYSKERLYRFNKNQPPGKSAVYKSTTLNPILYPNDPRLHKSFIKVQMRRLKEKPILFMTEANGNETAVFRFEPDTGSDIAIPYALFSLRAKGFSLPNQPKEDGWIWLDRNLNSQMESDEFEVKLPVKNKPQKTTDWWIESDGSLWAVANTSIYQFPIVRFDGDYPIWNFASAQEYSLPAPFVEARRFLYDAATDSAYIAGYTPDAPYSGDWKAIGKKLARFDNWSSQPQLKWIIDTPWDSQSKDNRQKSVAIDLEGDYIFIGLESTGKSLNSLEQSIIFVYDKAEAKYLGSMQHSNQVGPIMLDKGQGLNARKTSDGSYLIFVEDAAFARSIIFHWTPVKNASLDSGDNTFSDFLNHFYIRVGKLIHDWFSSLFTNTYP